ncbi:hypothetical protein [Pseudoalteromonas tunicata]|uniref:hypothetical protein n=1 Tax=Pseudoalteromonas tunicata TaxID=314281 RepID=UPI00273DA3B3|nr:hypothetical protein [Pseudoalteromonas tunicata]MDP4984880.1 hypothetical protein [Pseudoalteromonas tunicata]
MVQGILSVVLLIASISLQANTEFVVYSSAAENDPKSVEQSMFALVASALPDYDLVQRFAGVERSLKLANHEQNVCIRNLVSNPWRETEFYFSKPQTLFLGLKAYLSPRASSLFSQSPQSPISLAEFVTNNRLIIGIDKERSYGAQIDLEISKLAPQNKYVKEGLESEERMAKMLFANRIDLWLEYQTVLNDYKIKLNEQHQLKSFAVDGAHAFVTGHIACKKSPEALKLIEKINLILSQSYENKQFYLTHLQFIDSTLEATFGEIYQQFLSELR